MQEQIVAYLQTFNFKVKAFAYPLEALEALELERFNVVVLDLMLPQMDGFDLCRIIKERFALPILISSARGDIGNKIMGFELGADDYLAKPYEPRELVLRLEAILRRQSPQSNKLTIDNFTIDTSSRMVELDGYEIELTKVEFEILLYLIQNRGKALSREQIIHSSSLSEETKNRTVDMHISNIRNKIEEESKNPIYIKSVWGIGYKFV
jgi:DNA-binding response OmpR family regulator